MDKLKLKNPISINFEKVDEILFDFDAITINEIGAAERRCNRAGFTMAETDYSYHTYIAYYAAVAASNGCYSIEDLEQIRGVDVMGAMRLGRNFILQSLVEPEDEKPSDGSSEATPKPTSAATPS